jgi:hypothetical protein
MYAGKTGPPRLAHISSIFMPYFIAPLRQLRVRGFTGPWTTLDNLTQPGFKIHGLFNGRQGGNDMCIMPPCLLIAQHVAMRAHVLHIMYRICCFSWSGSIASEAIRAECRARCPSADLLLLPVNKVLDNIAKLCAAPEAAHHLVRILITHSSATCVTHVQLSVLTQ